MATTFAQRHYKYMAAKIAGSDDSKVEKLTAVKFLIGAFQDDSDKFKRNLFVQACGFTTLASFVGAHTADTADTADDELPLNVGFAIRTGEQSTIDEWFEESFGRPPNEKDWATLHKDIERIERNGAEFLRKKLGGTVVPEGSSGDEAEVVGTCHVKWSNREALEYVHGYYMDWHPRDTDTETAEALVEGTSELVSALNPEIEFFGIEEADMERIESILAIAQ